ncbi:MAG TPA: ATP-binding protein [Bacteroidales bacterium]|nr:ATP-binding protein [Bacteroidales bacterium]
MSSIPGGKFVYVNDSWLRLFEIHERVSVVGKSPLEAGLKEYVATSLNETSFKGKFKSFIRTIKSKKIEVTTTVKQIEIGGKNYIIASFEDLRPINKIKSDESRYRQIVECVNEGIWQINAELRTVFVSEKMAEMLGYRPSEMTGMSIFNFMDEEGKVLMNKKLEGENRYSKRTFGHKLIRKDDLYIHTSISSIPLFNEEGIFTGATWLVTNIADRIKIEKTLRKTRKKLEIALENGKIGTWEWNIKTGIVSCDDRAALMMGFKEESLDQDISIFENHINEEDLPHFREAVTNTINSGMPLETIFRTRHSEGFSSFISVKSILTHDRWGKPESLTGVCFDVTDMKRGVESALIKLNEELLRSNSDLKQFAYVASHDLQEPLRMVSSFTQLLQQKYKDKLDEDGNEYIKYAVEGSKRMYELLNGLLAYSRVQTRGRIFEKVDMNTVIEKVKANLRLIIQEKNVDIRSETLPVILADESQMIQLIQNLVENSIKFCNENPSIKISCERIEKNYIFSIKDHGIGIEAQYFEKIFKIFQRLHRSDEYKGTGIGLAICKRIAERHAGRIWVESDPGNGSTFYFTVPVYED